MRVTQLDYTAIVNANAARAQANSARISTLGQQQTNRNIKTQAEYLQKAISLNEEAMAANDRINTFNAFVNLAKFGLNLTENLITAKKNADDEKASADLSSMANDISSWIQNDVANNASSYFDENGNVIRSQNFSDTISQYRSQIEGWDVNKNTKENALKAFDSMVDSAWLDVQNNLLGREIDARNDSWNQQLDEALKIDLSKGSADTGLSLIDATTWLTPEEKTQLKSSYQKTYDSNYQSQTVVALASSGDIAGAYDFINGIAGLSVDEINTLKSLATRTSNTALANAVSQFSSSVQERLDSGVTPAIAMQNVNAELDATNLSDDFKSQIKESIKATVFNAGLKELDWPDDLSVLTGEELRTLEAKLDDEGDVLFPVELDKEKNALKALIQSEVEKRNSSNADANISSFKHIYASVEAGTISPSAGLSLMEAMVITGDNDNSDDAALLEYTKKIMNDIVPDKVKDLNKSYLGDFEDMVEESLNITNDSDPELKRRQAELVSAARKSALDFYYTRAGEDITDQQVMDLWQSINERYLGETITEFENLSDDIEGQSLVEEGVNGIPRAGNLEKTLKLLYEMPEGVISQQEDGYYSFSRQDVLDRWVEIENIERNLIEKNNLDDVEELVTIPYERTNADGTKTAVPVPVLQAKDGTRYAMKGSALMMQEKEGMQWVEVANISPDANLEEFMAPVSTDKPRVLLRDGNGGVIDETELPSDELNFISYVQSLENEGKPKEEQPAMNDPVAPAEIEEEEPEILVRNVYGRGMQFWFDGAWYNVDDLNEGGDIIKKYRAYMDAFDGRIPRVRK